MTRKEAIKYLRDIADNATLPPYQQALRIAIEDMERMELCGVADKVELEEV